MLAITYSLPLFSFFSKLLCQAAEIPKEGKVDVNEEKATDTSWWLGRKQKHPAKNGKVGPSTVVIRRGVSRGLSLQGSAVPVCRQPPGTHLIVPWQCNLTGWWENDLGSKMHVSTVDNQGNFSGEYYTAVSNTQKPIKPSPLVGSQHLDEDGQCTFGFTVNWKKFSGW